MHLYPREYNKKEEEIFNFPPSLWDIAGPGYLRKESILSKGKGNQNKNKNENEKSLTAPNFGVQKLKT